MSTLRVPVRCWLCFLRVFVPSNATFPANESALLLPLIPAQPRQLNHVVPIARDLLKRSTNSFRGMNLFILRRILRELKHISVCISLKPKPNQNCRRCLYIHSHIPCDIRVGSRSHTPPLPLHPSCHFDK